MWVSSLVTENATSVKSSSGGVVFYSKGIHVNFFLLNLHQTVLFFYSKDIHVKPTLYVNALNIFICNVWFRGSIM